jgi:hypothetical protein
MEILNETMRIKRIFQFGLLILLFIQKYETKAVNQLTQIGELNHLPVLGKNLYFLYSVF